MHRIATPLFPIALTLLLMTACTGRTPTGAEAELPPTPTVGSIATFTPTPVPPTPLPATPEPPEDVPDAALPTATPEEEPAAQTAAEEADDNAADDDMAADAPIDEAALAVLLAPTPTPAPAPLLVVSAEAVNIRSGPGTEYAQIGAAVRDEQFGIIGRNPTGDWWQICCVGDQPGWLFAPLVETRNADDVAVAANIPEPPVAAAPEPAGEEAAAEPQVDPIALEVEPQPAPPAEVEPQPEPPAQAEPEPEPATEPVTSALPPGQPAPTDGTAGSFDPGAQYQIVHFRTLGFDDNNGGIFNRGGQQLIFLTVLDAAGNGVDGVVVKNANADNLTVTTGDKGPGKTEIKMDWDPYKLYVVQDGSGPVTSHVSNQMNNPFPHIPDIMGLMGPADLEYAICPSIDDRCEPPFYHAHWSYEITFQKVR